VIEAAVLRLFEERPEFLPAEATRKLSLTRIQFTELTRLRGISHYDYTAEDLAADLADLDALESKIASPSAARRVIVADSSPLIYLAALSWLRVCCLSFWPHSHSSGFLR